MKEYAVVIEVWYHARSDEAAERAAEEMKQAILPREDVIQVQAERPEEQ